jgi:hypothetical protein
MVDGIFDTQRQQIGAIFSGIGIYPPPGYSGAVCANLYTIRINQ